MVCKENCSSDEFVEKWWRGAAKHFTNPRDYGPKDDTLTPFSVRPPMFSPLSVLPWTVFNYHDRRLCVGLRRIWQRRHLFHPHNFREKYAEHRIDTKVEVQREIIWPRLIIERLQFVPHPFFMRAFSSVIRSTPCSYMPAWHRFNWFLIFLRRVEWTELFSRAWVRMFFIAMTKSRSNPEDRARDLSSEEIKEERNWSVARYF